MKHTQLAVHAGGRSNGLTTLLIDHAIQQARAGESVEFWSTRLPLSDHAMSLCSKRLVETHHQEDISAFSLRTREVRFKTGGVIRFLSQQTDAKPVGRYFSTAIVDEHEYGTITREVKA